MRAVRACGRPQNEPAADGDPPGAQTSTAKLTPKAVPLADLRLNETNPRTITPERLEALARSIAAEPDMLQARPVIALPDGRVIAGNMRLRAAQHLGWKTIPTVTVDLDDTRAKQWLLRDNASYGEWDDGAVANLLLSLDSADFDLTGFSAEEIAEVIASSAPKSTVDTDDAPPLPEEEPRSKPGEVYELGPHRLMCGDATVLLGELLSGEKPDCLLTDPPYGINLDTDYRSMGTGSKNAILKGTHPRRYDKVIGDDAPFDPRPVLAVLGTIGEQFWFGADYYRRLLSADDRGGSWLVWDKRNEESDAGFGSGFELIWSFRAHKRDLLRHYFFGAFGQDGANRLHPTQKPIRLLADILTRWSPEGAVIVDPYAGSGSTLIAAEQTGRRCLAMEIDPRYCDVIRDRYAAFVAR